MQHNELQAALSAFGLGENESHVYLTILKNGELPVHEVAKRAGFSRMTIYSILDELTRRGLVSSVHRGNKHVFMAESPEKLLSIVKNRLNEYSLMAKNLEEKIGQLHSLQALGRPVVKLYEGEDAIEAIQSHMIDSGAKEIVEFGNLDDIRAHVGSKTPLKSFHEELDKKQISRRAIFFSNNKDSVSKKDDYSEIKIVNNTDGVEEFHGDIYVCGNRVGISTLDEGHVAVLIENKHVADTFRNIINLLWRKI